jgi:membrane-associated phospholipid phosphatase
MPHPHPQSNAHQDTASPATAAKVQLNWPLISGIGSFALGALLGGIVLVRGNTPLEADEEWMEEIVEHRSPLWDAPSYVLNFVGTGWFATLVSVLLVATLFFVLKRRWTALYALLAIGLSAVVVQGLKVAFGRLRPEDILLSLDSGSFPSGHVANAATLAAVLAIVTWRWWVVLVGSVYVILMALSRTYLGAHWVSDTVGGLLIGAGAAIILWAPFAFRMLRERRGEVPVAPQPADTAAGQEARDNGSPNQ